MLVLKSNSEYIGDIAALPYLPPLEYQTPIAAYSLRKLKGAYAGFAIEVVRSSDSQSMKVGFSSGKLDTTAMLEFATSFDLRVSKWFDQSGNGYDLSISSQVLQPIIVKSGKLVVDAKGFPTIEFNGTTNKLIDSADSLGKKLGSSLNYTSYAVFSSASQSADSNNLRRICGFNYTPSVSVHKTSLYMSTETNVVSFGARGAVTASTTILSASTDNSNNVALSYFKGQRVGLKVNESAMRTAEHATANSAGGGGRFIVGSSNANNVESSNFAGKLSEIILFDTDIPDEMLISLQVQLNSYYR